MAVTAQELKGRTCEMMPPAAEIVGICDGDTLLMLFQSESCYHFADCMNSENLQLYHCTFHLLL